MLRNMLGRTGWLSAALCFMLLVTTVMPFGIGVVHANGGLNFIGISNNTSPTNPHIHYSPEITIQGTYPTDVNGEDLRYEVTSLSGSQPSDTSSVRPIIDPANRIFTFRNIELLPGVNKISFFFNRTDGQNTNLSTLYVQYNNTPLFSDLRIGTVNLDSDPTVVEINSTRNLTLDLSGTAVNATRVVATNKTTGKTFSDDTSSSGRFTIEFEALVGLNEVDIHAYSQNREVGLIGRRILVIPAGNVEGRADQFYNVTIGNTPLTQIPPAKTELTETGTLDISGDLMIKVMSGATILDSDSPVDTTAPDAPVNVMATPTAVKGIAEADSTITVYKGTTKLSNTIKAGANGEFTVPITEQPLGEVLRVTATDDAGNESQPFTVTVTEAEDTTPPSAPASLALISGKITGTAEAGSLVIVRVGAVELGRSSAASNQLFEVTIPAPNPGTTLSVTATDAAGNESPAAVFQIPGTDTTPPDAPIVDPVDSSATKVTGIAEAGTTITVTNPSGTSWNGTAGNDGRYEVTITAQPAGTQLSVTATDAAGGQSAATTRTVTVAPVTPPTPPQPAKPSVVPPEIKISDRSMKGTAEPLSTITVTRGATVLGTAVADGAGNFDVTLSAPAIGDKLSVTATKNGQVSDALVVTVTGQNSLNLRLNDLDTSNAIALSNVTFTPVTGHSLSSEYKLYKVEAELDSGNLDHNHTYELQVTYQTQRQDPGNLSNIINDVTVENYSYLFVYKKGDQPRFGKVTDISNPDVELPIKTDGSVNIINTLPAKVKIEAFNMGAATDFEVFYNNTKKKAKAAGVDNPDYELTKNGDSITIEFINLPASETTVKVVHISSNEQISFKLKPEVVPSLLFYYTASGQTKVIDSTLEITDSNVSNFVVDGNTFKGQLYNYALTNSNMLITLNGEKIDYSVQGSGANKAVPFVISKNQFVNSSGQWKFNQGSNTLLFTLKDDPSVKFTYTIIYNTQKTPKIENVTLKVIQGKNDEVELKKTSTDSAYQTSAYFLSELSFGVANVEKDATVSIKKDGNVIAKYQLQDSSGNWTFLGNDSEYRKTRDAAIKGNTIDLGNIFDATTFSKAKDIRGKFTFSAEMDADEYGKELMEELTEDMGLSSAEVENRLKLFPLTLAKGGTTNYQIEVAQGSIVTRHTISIGQETQAWTVISPKKAENAPYITVNSNSVPIKIFAENATKVKFGKVEAVAYNTTEPDYDYDEDTGKLIPRTYYVFESNVTLKKGLNTIKFTVEFGQNVYNDEIKIYNLNSMVGGAEYRDTLGKKTSFSVFDKAFELKFPSGTVLLAPSGDRAGSEVHAPDRDIFTDVTLYFGIADRTNGRVTLDDDDLRDEMEDLMGEIDSKDFNYASPLYYVDAGNAPPAGEDDDDEERAPGGRDPYFDGTVNGIVMEPFIERWEYNLVPSKEGTVTIQYDSSIVNAANNVLTVFYNNGDRWKNIGGVVNTSRQTITVPFAGFGYYTVMMTRETFSDVITHPFARDAVETLYAKGIMGDAPGEGFGTELKIRRGEFATMLVKALDLPINAGPYDSRGNPTKATFRDVHPDLDDWDYQYEYIETAARAGIVRGKDISSFEPYGTLTREEAAIMITRALNLKTGTVEAAQASLGKMFTDAKSTGYYAAPSVLAVAKAKIMNGEPNDPTAKKPTYRFNPKGDLTRAEMAVITIRIMQQLKKLPKQ